MSGTSKRLLAQLDFREEKEQDMPDSKKVHMKNKGIELYLKGWVGLDWVENNSIHGLKVYSVPGTDLGP